MGAKKRRPSSLGRREGKAGRQNDTARKKDSSGMNEHFPRGKDLVGGGPVTTMKESMDNGYFLNSARPSSSLLKGVEEIQPCGGLEGMNG